MQAWMVVVLRSLSLFILTFVAIRVMGKRQPARLTAFNFMCYIVIGIIAALVSVNAVTNFIWGLLALGVWVAFTIGLEYLAIKSKWVHDWLYGRETVLIKQGKILEKNLLQVRMTGEELLRELRSKNAFNVADVEFALMEPTGDLNVLLKSDRRPVTPHDLGRKVSPQTEPQTVILDGNILNDPLADLGLNQAWLSMKLESLGVALENVFLGQIDTNGDLYVDLFNDSVKIPQPKIKEMLYANLEKSQSDLMKFALETQDQEAKNMYWANADRLKKLTVRLGPYLLK